MNQQADPNPRPSTLAGQTDSAARAAIQAVQYMPGFGNDFETEALPDALPQGMNSPQKAITGFTVNSCQGLRSPPPQHRMNAVGVAESGPRSNIRTDMNGLPCPLGKLRRISTKI